MSVHWPDSITAILHKKEKNKTLTFRLGKSEDTCQFMNAGLCIVSKSNYKGARTWDARGTLGLQSHFASRNNCSSES